jgi:CheY-like chemotaxis protein
MAASEPPSNANETVLYVEDDADVRETVELLLDALGYRLVSAASGAEAYGLLRDNEGIDLLFSDVVMPGGMNGVELAEKARGLRPDLKIVLTSGYSDSLLKLKASELADVHWLAKPFQFDDLARAIRDALDGVPASPPD